MCEQTPVSYNHGDIVWVKVKRCWWPGEVIDFDKLPTEISSSLKKPPFAVVKFFQEDTYEYVKNINQIYSYNCSKKVEFIQKGLNLFRQKISFMETFPKDIEIAETKTEGNPNILSDPVYTPQKKEKRSYDNIFGGSKESPKSHQSSPSNVTHPRFLGYRNDYEVKYLIQSPEVRDVPENTYTCMSCNFKTTRVDIIVLHNKSHIDGTLYKPFLGKRKSKQAPKKKKPSSTKTQEKKFHSEDSSDNESDEEPKRKKKARTVSAKKRVAKKTPKTADKVEKPKTDIRTDLLAEWDDDSNSDDDTLASHASTSAEKSFETSDFTSHKDAEEVDTDDASKSNIETASEEPQASTSKDKSPQKEIESCFDFVEDEDTEVDILPTASGRKIPRVIPPNEKRKSEDLSNSEIEPKIANDEVPKPVSEEILDEKDKVPSQESAVDPEKEANSVEPAVEEKFEDNIEAFEEILESTVLPKLPEIPQLLKCEQNFHCAKTIKFPDKPDSEESSENASVTVKEKKSEASKIINPKKRFVKSFEDETQLIEQKKIEQARENELLETESQDSNTTEKETVPPVEVNKEISSIVEAPASNIESPSKLQVSKLKTQLMSKLKEIPTSSICDTKDPLSSASTESKTDSSKLNEISNDFEVENIGDYAKFKYKKGLRRNRSRSVKYGEDAKVEEPENCIVEPAPKAPETPDQTDNIPVYSEPTTLKNEEPTAFKNEEPTPFKNEEPTPLINEEPILSKNEEPTPSKNEEPTPLINEEPILSKNEEPISSENKEPTPLINEEPSDIGLPETKLVVEQEVVPIVPEESVKESIVSKNEVSLPEQAKEILEDFDVSEEQEIEWHDTAEDKLSRLDSESNNKDLPETVAFDSNAQFPEEIVENTLPEKITESSPTDSVSVEEEKSHSSLEPIVDVERPISPVYQKNKKRLRRSSRHHSHKETEDPPEKQAEESHAKIDVAEIEDKPSDVTENIDPPKEDSITTNNNENIPAPSILSDILKDSISTNNESEDTSALSTLAAVSELTTKQNETLVMEKNITVMNENDLENSQVEIANVPADIDGQPQPVTLSTFSMDFSDFDDTKIETISKSVDVKDNLLEKVEQDLKPKDSATVGDIENQTPSQGCNKNSVESQMAKLTDTNPDMSPLPPQVAQKTSSSKLLDILTDHSKTNTSHKSRVLIKSRGSNLDLHEPSESKESSKLKFDPKNSKFIIKSASNASSGNRSKPIILSEKIIKPADTESVSVQKVTTSKRTYQDVEDIDTFIIQKPVKKPAVEEREEVTPKIAKKTPISIKGHTKPRIIQQTIITPSGDIIQPNTSQPQTSATQDDFDINSMPIVLSDQILTPESLETMPIVLSDNVQVPSASKSSETPLPGKKTILSNMKLIGKSPAVSKEQVFKTTQSPAILRTISQKTTKPSPKLYTTANPKIIKNTPIISTPGKSGKFIIVPSATGSVTGSKYTVSKKITAPKKPGTTVLQGTGLKGQGSSEPTGNKVMIVTNNLGQQSRVVLTPAQQKLLGCQSSGTKIIKGAIKQTISKNLLRESTASPSGTSKLVTQTIISPKGQISTTNPTTQQILTAGQQKGIKLDGKGNKKIQLSTQRLYTKVTGPQQRAIVIKTQQGQTIKRIQGTDDALLEQQVAEQIQAINKANERQLLNKSQSKLEVGGQKTNRMPIKKSYGKKQILVSGDITKQATTSVQKQTAPSAATSSGNQSVLGLPALAPISPTKKPDVTLLNQNKPETVLSDETGSESQKQPASYVIQDALGNQTTITEGQILAFPSETVDGQPQSYMLVTVDESGNLKPLNNETLMTLDPNLSLGGDLGNMVLQIDQGDQSQKLIVPANQTETPEKSLSAEKPDDALKKSILSTTSEAERVTPTTSQLLLQAKTQTTTAPSVTSDVSTPQTSDPNIASIVCNTNENNQQLFITGDPVATQKLIDSLAEGNADLANILANAEGNILIQADGQQFLINTGNTDSQMLLTMNTDVPSVNSPSDVVVTGNPVFGSQPSKNQDILAAALADTDVFQQEPSQSKVIQSQLSPNSTLYPMNVSGVLETSAMSSPIMSPLETPKNNKKINDESDILTQVPKNVDLPITITDPNISQTVSQQQVASLIAKELQSNLELPLSITDPSASVTSTEMNSPSYVFSLPSLEDSVGITQKPFTPSISMPLLSDEPEETLVESEPVLETVEKPETPEVKRDSPEETSNGPSVHSVPSITDSNMSDSKIEKEEPLEEKSSGEPFMGTVSDGLCSMRGGICNSLSEPPPDMFDFPIGQSYESTIGNEKPNTDVDLPIDSSTENTNESSLSNNMNEDVDLLNQDSLQTKPFEHESNSEELEIFERQKSATPTYTSSLTADLNSPSTNNTDENSCEIPVQPEIITDLNSTTFENKVNIENDLDDSTGKRKFTDSDEEDSLGKRCKFD